MTVWETTAAFLLEEHERKNIRSILESGRIHLLVGTGTVMVLPADPQLRVHVLSTHVVKLKLGALVTATVKANTKTEARKVAAILRDQLRRVIRPISSFESEPDPPTADLPIPSESPNEPDA